KEKQKKALELVEKLKRDEMAKEEDKHEEDKKNLKADFEKQKEEIKKRITQPEQRGITLQEIDIKEREAFRQMSDKFLEQKSQKMAFYDRVIRIVKSIKKNETLEEDDYLFLK